jgi:DNA polymerase III delta' subunit
MSHRQIFGYDQHLQILERLAKRPDQLIHAWRFEGPAHVGKQTIARWWTRVLLCARHPGSGCGSCPSCRAFQGGGHPDVLDLSQTDERQGYTVEDIRQLRTWMSRSPFLGNRKIILLDDADRMTMGASNAMLKFLEEPSPQSMFILVTHNPTQLLGTIRSRCSPLRFSLLSQEKLRNIVAQRALKIPDSRMISACRGQIGLLLHWMNHPNDWETHLSHLSDLFDWILLPVDLRIRHCDQLLDEQTSFLDQQKIAKQWIEDMIMLIRDHLLSQWKSIFVVWPHVFPSPHSHWSPSRLLQLLEAGLHGLNNLSRNAQPKMVLESFALHFND